MRRRPLIIRPAPATRPTRPDSPRATPMRARRRELRRDELQPEPIMVVKPDEPWGAGWDG